MKKHYCGLITAGFSILIAYITVMMVVKGVALNNASDSRANEQWIACSNPSQGLYSISP